MSGDVLDTHVHLWDLEHVRLSWFRDELGLPRRVGPGELERAAGSIDGTRARFRGAIAVQAADTVGEARWLLAQAAAHPAIRAVVLQYNARPGAWAGMAQPLMDEADATEGASAPRIAGMRLATPGGAADFGDVPGLEALAAGLTRTGRVLELLIRPGHLRATAALARRHPGLSIVVDHLGLGAAEPDGTWRRGIDALAAVPNVSAKLSGLVTGAAGDGRRLAGLAELAFAAFGTGRLMFGSDWPMSARTVPYREVVARTAVALPALSRDEARAFWSGTATRRYGLGSAGPAG